MFDSIKNVFNNKNQPDVVIILLDQFRDDARDSHKIFEELGKRGVLFSTTITYAPYTLASCHATFTGMYGRDNGVDAYTKSHNYYRDECVTIAQYLKKSGYHTRAYTFSSILIPHDGFDSVTVVEESDENDVLKSHLNELDSCANQKKPFFSYLHYGEIHHSVLKNVIRKYSYEDDEYYNNINDNKQNYKEYAKQAGDYLERTTQKIDEISDNKIIIVMTDHGASNGEKFGEKAYGSFTYDYSIKVWHYWIWDRKLPANLEIEKQVRTVDILPTLLDVLNIKRNNNKKPIFGTSLMPMITGSEQQHRMAFSETGGVDGPYPSLDSPNIMCVRDGDWKLIFNKQTNHYELYNLIADPEEDNNLYDSEPEVANKLWLNMIQYL